MAIIKTSPSELAIHGGGPPAFASRVPTFSANAGDGHRFAELAERMFHAGETPGRLAEEFEDKLSHWLNVRNVIGFSSVAAAVRCLERSIRVNGKILVPAFGSSAFWLEQNPIQVECEPATYGMSPLGLAEQIRNDDGAVFAVNPLARTCMIDEIYDLCEDHGAPLFLYGHQSLGCSYKGERLGGFGRAEIYELGRDQLVHAMDAAVIVTDDDLLAHRLRTTRSAKVEGTDQAMGDASAAMGIANLESAESFVDSNRRVYMRYRELLLDIPGVSLIRHDESSTFQSITVEIDPGLAGVHRDGVQSVLTSENVGTERPFEGGSALTPIAHRLQNSLLQLPAGPVATDAVIEAVCKLVELAIVRSLESPDPIRLAA